MNLTRNNWIPCTACRKAPFVAAQQYEAWLYDTPDAGQYPLAQLSWQRSLHVPACSICETKFSVKDAHYQLKGVGHKPSSSDGETRRFFTFPCSSFHEYRCRKCLASPLSSALAAFFCVKCNKGFPSAQGCSSHRRKKH